MTTVFEALDRKKQPKFGAHIVAVMPNAVARDRAIEALNGSSAYEDGTGFSESGHPVFAEPVTDWAGLTTYLAQRGDAAGAVPEGLSSRWRLNPARRSRRG